MNNRSLLWIPIVFLAAAALALSTASGRATASRLIGSLREPKVQTVSVNLSSFVGPDANHNLQQLVSQMVSDKVRVTTNEKEQPVPSAAAASQLAGFEVRLPRNRQDAPRLTVMGEHAFHATVDRARLQDILNQSGRPDLRLLPSVDGATLDVRTPRAVRAQYGTCPGPPSAAANVATPAPATTGFTDCVVLTEGKSPEIKVPPGLDAPQLVEIGLELAGMTPPQARDFLKTLDWKSVSGLSLPRFMRSYEAVQVNGAKGTLMDMAGRRGPTYALIWPKDGITYSLTGFGNSNEAVALADSLR